MQIIWVSLASCESMQDVAKNPRHVAGMRGPWRQTERRCHCQFVHQKPREGGRDGNKGKDGQTDRGHKKERMNGRRVWCKESKSGREELRNKPSGGVRCLEATPETEGWGGGERGRKMDGADPCWVSVSYSRLRLLCAPVSTVGESEECSSSHHTSPLILLHFSCIFSTFSFIKNRSTCNPLTYPHPRCPPILPTSLPCFFSLSLSLIRGHFHFKAPLLSAISEGN